MSKVCGLEIRKPPLGSTIDSTPRTFDRSKAHHVDITAGAHASAAVGIVEGHPRTFRANRCPRTSCALIRESGTWTDEKRLRMHCTRYKGRLKNNDVVESTSELGTSVGGKLPRDGALHRWPLF